MTSTESTTGRARWPFVAAAVVAVVVAAGVGVAVADDDEPRAMGRSARLDDFQHDCEDWMDHRGSGGTGSTWCSDMSGWIDGQIRDGHMTSRMWNEPRQMLDTCTRWMDTDAGTAPEGTDPATWCRDMLAWMGHDIDDQDDGMGPQVDDSDDRMGPGGGDQDDGMGPQVDEPGGRMGPGGGEPDDPMGPQVGEPGGRMRD